MTACEWHATCVSCICPATHLNMKSMSCQWGNHWLCCLCTTTRDHSLYSVKPANATSPPNSNWLINTQNQGGIIQSFLRPSLQQLWQRPGLGMMGYSLLTLQVSGQFGAVPEAAQRVHAVQHVRVKLREGQDAPHTHPSGRGLLWAGLVPTTPEEHRRRERWTASVMVRGLTE